MGVYGYTLGCRLNACETDEMIRAVSAGLGLELTSDPTLAEVAIVNTCAVTQRSQARSRKAVRKLAGLDNAPLVVSTGCAASLFPEEFAAAGAGMVVPMSMRERLPELLAREGVPCRGARGVEQGISLPGPGAWHGSRSRAFLKVQEGCSRRCAYCIVPLARGASRSVPLSLVLDRASTALRAGYRELVLTGVDIADYGDDECGDLPGLVSRLLALDGRFRIRLSSMEPMALESPGFLERLALPGVCRHFHVPIQSGSDSVLASMGRAYTADSLSELFARIGRLFPGAAIGADLLAGFPGETGDDFERTVRLLERLSPAYLHVFPFSPRPGTRAAGMPRVRPDVVVDRCGRLRQIGAELRRRFRRSQEGTRAEAIVERRRDRSSSDGGTRLIGLTDNYVPVELDPGHSEGELTGVALGARSICWDVR
ncbi:MiaB/RimO family radical SAM methylthiotransferase [Candidatus Fermentibacterales bacterium]|nr:MiaB/RimO family radical SAM methylthiotransferase [Candidatus Fermentibacterales bacterium]